MAQSVATLSAQISERARDPSQTGTTGPNVISLLSFAQQVVNGILADVTVQDSLPLVSRQAIYPIFSNWPDSVRVLSIKDASGRNLVPFRDFAGLRQVATNWPSLTSSAPRSYALCGRDLLIIYPAVATSLPTLTITSAKLTTTLTSGAQTTEVTNDDDDAVLDITEALLLLKSRDLSDVQKIIDRFKTRIEGLKTEPK
jgi:hypothetical protein